MTATSTAQTLLLEECLRQLKLPVFLAQYAKVAQEAAAMGHPAEQFLLLLAEQELAQRDENRQKRRIAEAKFPTIMTLDQYDFSLVPQLNRTLILELAQGRYLATHENILLAGYIGTGKTHIATALAVAACQQSARVHFFTAAGLTNELLEAQAANRLTRLEASLLRLDLIILDEVGFVPFTKAGADLLFSCLAALHEHVSLIVTTTVPFAQWAELLGGDQRLAAALLDRLTFHAPTAGSGCSSFRGPVSDCGTV